MLIAKNEHYTIESNADNTLTLTILVTGDTIILDEKLLYSLNGVITEALEELESEAAPTSA